LFLSFVMVPIVASLPAGSRFPERPKIIVVWQDA
jgi:hypothetical protein